MLIQQIDNQIARTVSPEQAGFLPVQETKSSGSASDNPDFAASQDFFRMKEIVEKVNNVVHGITTELTFSIDQQAREVVVKVVDKATQTIIRQMPSEEMLTIAKRMDEFQGLIIRQKA